MGRVYSEVGRIKSEVGRVNSEGGKVNFKLKTNIFFQRTTPFQRTILYPRSKPFLEEIES